MKNKLFLVSLVCLVTMGCKIEHVHIDEPLPPLPPPPVFEPATCAIAYHYKRNTAPGAVEPVVTCSVRDADSYVNAKCYMEFRALGLPIVIDKKTITTDSFGDANITVSNGNCYSGEKITLYAECVVDGEKLTSMDTGYIDCGFFR